MKKLLTVLGICLCIGGFSACDLNGAEILSSDTASVEQSMDNSTDNLSSSPIESSSISEESASEEESSSLVHTHEWEEDLGTVTTAPTCETAGVKTFTCACGYTETAEIPALGHNYENDICTVCGEERIVSQGLEYTLNADNVSYSVTGIGTCADTDLVIASTYNNLPVTIIGDYVFSGCDSLTSIEIPDSVTSIGEEAFDWCTSLTSVEIPDSVTSIGDEAFYRCTSLTSITVSENNSAYQSIDGNLYTKDGTILIQYAIGKMDTSFTIPDSVTSIGDLAFWDCDSLTSVEIGDSVTSIGGGAFYNCTSLTSVEIPDSVTSIGNSAFAQCYRLTSVVIGDSVTSIGGSAFYRCTSLTSVKIGDSVTSIGYGAFYNCDSLISVEIPDSVTSIGRYAFSGCDSLTSVVIGDSVTSIGEYAFRYCDSLTSVYYKGTAEEWSDISIDSGNTYLTNANRYYYSESQPTEEGNWWHYVEGVPTAWAS